MAFPYDMVSGGEAWDKLRPLLAADGPRDRWRAGEDGSATFGNTLAIGACLKVGVDVQPMEHWFRGIILGMRYVPPVVASQDKPSVQNDPHVAAAELYRLTSLVKIHWCSGGDAPPDLRVCPSQLVPRLAQPQVRLIRCAGAPSGQVWRYGRLPTAFALWGIYGWP